jgi:HEAT repeat protein
MLANIGSEDAAKVLLTMLADTDAGVRQSARNALVHVKAQALDGAVIAVLLAGDRHLLTGVDEALPLLRETLEPGMLARLTGERASSMECAAAAYALGRMKSKVATPILAEYAKTDKALVAVTCAHALYSIGDEGSLRELAGLIDSSYVEVRRAAVYGLVRIGGPEVLEKLTAVASGKTETNLGLRQEAVMLLGYVGDWSTVDLLINLIKQQAGLGRAAAHALERLTGLSVGDRPYLWTDWYNEIVAQQKAAEEPPPPLVPAQARQGAVPGLPPEGFPFIP